MKAQFKPAATKPFSLQAAAAQTYAQFPQLKDSVVFVDCSTGAIITDNAEMKSKASIAMNTNRDLYQAQRYYNQHKTCGFYQTGGIGFVLFYPKEDINFLPEEDTQKRLHFVFNHEMAHRLAPLAQRQNALSESVSDTYAALCHLQQHGQDDKFFAALEQKRARSVTEENDFEYFTCPAVSDAVKNAKTYASEQQTPSQLVTLAMKIAEATHVSNDEAKKLATKIIAKPKQAVKKFTGKRPQ